MYNDYHTPFPSDIRMKRNTSFLVFYLDTVVTLVIETYLKDIKKKKRQLKRFFSDNRLKIILDNLFDSFKNLPSFNVHHDNSI